VTTYKIIRFHADLNLAPDVIKSGLTLSEAQEHCKSPETSSRTATSEAAMAYTQQFGEWFDGYSEDDGYIDYGN
jgi:hypothetical protein